MVAVRSGTITNSLFEFHDEPERTFSQFYIALEGVLCCNIALSLEGRRQDGVAFVPSVRRSMYRRGGIPKLSNERTTTRSAFSPVLDRQIHFRLEKS